MVRAGRKQTLIRAATAADAAAIALHRYPDESDTAESDAAERPIYAEWVADAIGRGLYLGFVAEEAGQVIAGAGLSIMEWGPSRGDPQPFRARLVNVWVRPDFRRRGLARELVQLCLHAAQGRGLGIVSLGTSDMARGLYTELGFAASQTEMYLRLEKSP